MVSSRRVTRANAAQLFSLALKDFCHANEFAELNSSSLQSLANQYTRPTPSSLRVVVSRLSFALNQICIENARRIYLQEKHAHKLNYKLALFPLLRLRLAANQFSEFKIVADEETTDAIRCRCVCVCVVFIASSHEKLLFR